MVGAQARRRLLTALTNGTVLTMAFAPGVVAKKGGGGGGGDTGGGA
jgi:hypothetical protein